jgi:hypothetical protein
MQPLKLSPLPCAIPAEQTPSAIRGECGFVDDGVVRALMAGPVFSPRLEYGRPAVAPKGTVLDFAGWSLPRPAATVVVPASEGRPDPPVLTEPGLGEPHCGPHRWWLAGMAGATCSVLFAVLLLHLSAHVSRDREHFITISPTNNAPATPKQIGSARKATPQWTRLQDNTLSPPATGD